MPEWEDEIFQVDWEETELGVVIRLAWDFVTELMLFCCAIKQKCCPETGSPSMVAHLDLVVSS
jgi:hypothetical protein